MGWRLELCACECMHICMQVEIEKKNKVAADLFVSSTNVVVWRVIAIWHDLSVKLYFFSFQLMSNYS